MRASFQKIFSICLLVLATFSCKKGTIDLRLHPPAGADYTMDYVTKAKINLIMAGKEIGTSMLVTVQCGFRMDSLPDDRLRLDIAFKNYDLQQLSDKDSIKVNVEKEDTASSENPFSFLKHLRYEMVMLPTGEVESVKDSGNAMQRFDSILPEMPIVARQKILAAIKPFISEQMIKGIIEQGFHVFPEEKVNIGDSWKNEIVIQNMFNMVVKSKYTLESINNGIAILNVHAEIAPETNEVVMPGLAMSAPKGTTPKPEAKSFDFFGAKMTAAFHGQEDGKVWMDMNSGMIQKHQLNQHLEGKISIGLFDLPMTMDLEPVYEVKRVAKTSTL